MNGWIVSASLLISGVLLLRRFFRRKISPRLQYALWLIVLLRLLVPFSLGESRVGFANMAPDEGIYPVYGLAAETAAPDKDMEYSEPGYKDTETKSKHNNIYNNINYVNIAELVYAVGAVLVLLCFALSNTAFYARLRKERRKLNVDFCLPVYEVQSLDSPCLFGIMKPAVYILPENREDENKLYHILVHENMHYRQLDHIWAVGRLLCLALHWYNPLVWAAAAASKRDGELACDEAALKFLGETERFDYGRTILSLSFIRQPGILSAGISMSGSKRGLRERIRFVAEKPKTAMPAVALSILAAVLLLWCSFSGAIKTELQAAGEKYSDSYLSEDGKVRISIGFELPEIPEAMDNILLEYGEFKIDDGKRLAGAVFDDSPLLDFRDKSPDREYLEMYIAACEALLADEARLERVIYGDSSVSDKRAWLEDKLSEARQLHATAASVAERGIMQWEYGEDSSVSEIYALHPDSGSIEYRALSIDGMAERDGYDYSFIMVDRSDDNRQLKSISAFICPYTSGGVYYAYLMDELLSKEAPDEKALELAMTEAQKLVAAISDEQWQLELDMVLRYQNCGYILRIIAVRCYDFCPVLSSGRSVYQNNEEIEMEFSSDGRLLSLQYHNPSRLKSCETDALPLIGAEEALSKLKDYLQSREADSYSGLPDGVESFELKLENAGLYYMREALPDGTFRLVPVLFYDGKLCWSDEDMNYETLLFLSQNAVDGSIIYAG